MERTPQQRSRRSRVACRRQSRCHPGWRNGPARRQSRASPRRRPAGRPDRPSGRPAFCRRRVRAAECGATDPRPRFHTARGLSADIGKAPRFANFATPEARAAEPVASPHGARSLAIGSSPHSPDAGRQQRESDRGEPADREVLGREIRSSNMRAMSAATPPAARAPITRTLARGRMSLRARLGPRDRSEDRAAAKSSDVNMAIPPRGSRGTSRPARS
jgi:hypothetical protein